MRRRLLTLLCLTFVTQDILAHGERAQLAGMRMRTLHWFDTQVMPNQVNIGDEVTVRGKFIPSEHWPAHLPGLDDAVYLNVGVPGPSFIRIKSTLNGVPMIRSTALEEGKLYEYEMILRARVPGRYHVHPLLNVKDVGSLVGKGTWVEVAATENGEPFVNELQTMRGDIIDLETYGLGAVKFWHGIWFAVGLAWLVFWLIRRELFIPRFNWVRDAVASGETNPDDIITKREFLVGGGFLTATLAIILTGYLYAEAQFPTTIPLQTGKVDVQGMPVPKGPLTIDVTRATYKLDGRSLSIEATMTNTGTSPISISEFATANIRFINPATPLALQVRPDEEMVAERGLEVSVGTIAPGDSIDVNLLAADSLWETQRMTGLIYDPDSRFAGLLFYRDESDLSYVQEIGGSIVPSFF